MPYRPPKKDGLPPSRQRGFSLVEILVTMLIISVLLALIMVVFSKIMDSAQQAKCMSLQKAMVRAATTYAADHGYYPSSLDKGKNYWPANLTEYMGYENTASNRGSLYTCPKLGTDGRKEYIAHNMWMGYSELEDSASAKIYIRINPARVPQPSKTSLFTCGFNRQPGNDTQRHYYYRFGRGTGSDSVNRTKFNGGSVWSFVDGHAEWLSEEDVIERSGSNGQGLPFIKPY